MIYVSEVNCVFANYIARLQVSFAQSSKHPLRPSHSHAETVLTLTAGGREAERE